LTHPNPAAIGKRVWTDPSRALAGHDEVSVRQNGSLGTSVRSKVPVHGAKGRVVGEVSVGFTTDEVSQRLRELTGPITLVAVGGLALGTAASVLLTRRLRRQTLGLEPGELAALVSDREAVLHGIGEGVLAVDADDRVTVCNAEAARLLGIDGTTGVPVRELNLPARLAATVDRHEQVDDLMTIAGSKVLVVRLRKVHRGDRYLGLVLTIRDRTELDSLTRELDSVRGLTDGLRAQQHEFTNRLHTLSGLLQLGHNEDAVDYVQDLTSGNTGARVAENDSIADPHLRALLSAKAVAAQEKNVEVRIGDGSWVSGKVVEPVLVTTVVGNLIDNAVRASSQSARRPAYVEVELLGDGETLHVAVLDSGDGVPESLRDNIFIEGTSTKDESGHGLGLALVSQAAASVGGRARLTDPGNAEHGALFVASLPSTLRAGRQKEVTT
jgi:two-component system CitB family sensor kinase